MITSRSRQTTRNLRDYLHGCQEEMIALLAQLVNAESPSLVPSAQNKVITILQRELRQRSYRVRYLPGQQTGGAFIRYCSRWPSATTLPTSIGTL